LERIPALTAKIESFACCWVTYAAAALVGSVSGESAALGDAEGE
jgi:hypothetical protein